MKTYKEITRSIHDGEGWDVRFGVDKNTLKRGDLVIGFDELSENPYDFQVFEVDVNVHTKKLVLDNMYGQVDVDMWFYELYEATQTDWDLFCMREEK